LAEFRALVDRGVRLADGVSSYPMDTLDAAGVSWSFVDETVRELSPAQIEGWDAVIVGGAGVSASSVDCERPPLLIARLGAGYDTVAVQACTERGILVTTAPDGVRRAMASGGIAFLLALAHRLVEKDHRTRAGIWDRTAIGPGLSGRTLGVLGLGNIGRDVCALASTFALRRIAHDIYPSEVDGVELVDFETLLRESDFLIVTLPLTDETYHLLNAERLALMKPSAYVINIARGPIVDQAALTEALAERRLAGAALDVFEEEPLDKDDPLLQLDNVIVASHDIGLTLEMTNDVARSACRAVVDVAEGRVPTYVLNPEALGHPRLQSLRRG
jgi:phosphoglycerate dehydrogenase-like enzyme